MERIHVNALRLAMEAIFNSLYGSERIITKYA